jgi:hypothetical protein
MKEYLKIRHYPKIVITVCLIAFLIGLINGCDLTETTYSNPSVKDFYKNKTEAQVALNGVYSTFWGVYKDHTWLDVTDVPGGVLVDENQSVWNTFDWTISEDNFKSIWNNLYSGINKANTLLDRIKKSDISDDVKANISGQAKFLRALSYFDLVKLFGGVPLYEHGTTNLKNADKSRSSADSVYEQIVKDLKDAADALSPYSESDHEAGKATSGAAKALLAQVYAQQQKWSKAASTAKEVINSSHFGLLKDYNNIFDGADDVNKEQIFSIMHGNNGPITSNETNHNVLEFGPPKITLKDGTHIQFLADQRSVVWSVDENLFNQASQTYRKWQTMRKKMPYYFIVNPLKYVQDTVALNKPYVVKFLNVDKNTAEAKKGVNTPIVRYSNVLLIYAEALNMANNSPTAAAYTAINKVRARARGVGTGHEQSKNVYSPLSGLSQKQFTDSVLTEEAREFVGEGHRRAELLRHGRFIKDAQKRGISDAQKYKKLYPIPFEEIQRNDNLKQNPGYSGSQ